MNPGGIVRLEPAHRSVLRAFLDGLPDRDATFIKEDIRDPTAAERWASSSEAARRWIWVEGNCVVALGVVVPLAGWSSHVGSLRLVVDPAARRRGIGRTMAHHALQQAIDMGLTKLMVEVVAEQESDVRMFDALGFRGEALLTAHIRDRSGQLRDLLVLAHDLSEEWSVIASLGVADDLGESRGAG